MNATGITSMRTRVTPINYHHEIALAQADLVEIDHLHSHTNWKTMAADQRNLRLLPNLETNGSFGTSMADALATALVKGGAA